MQENKPLPLSAKQLRALYGVSKDTWKKWISPLGDLIPDNVKVYKPIQVEAIVKLLGRPD